MPRNSKPLSPQEVGLKYGFRSGLEEKIAKELGDLGVPFLYEDPDSVIKYTQPAKPRTYTPDFTLPNGIIIETKGRFVTADRQKHLMIQEQHPELDIRFVFDRASARISKTSKTTYAKWCQKHGFQYAEKSVPREWLEE